jgi:hypothetical protein
MQLAKNAKHVSHLGSIREALAAIRENNAAAKEPDPDREAAKKVETWAKKAKDIDEEAKAAFLRRYTSMEARTKIEAAIRVSDDLRERTEEPAIGASSPAA